MSSLLGLIGVVYGLYYALNNHATGFNGYFDKTSCVLLLLVPPSIMLLSHKLGDFWTGVRLLLQSMFANTHRQQNQVINALSVCSAKVRTEGVGCLVNERKNVQYELLVDGLSLILNNFSADEIRHNLFAKINMRQSELSLASHLFESMSKVAPGVGMMGTVMGLVQMMSHISDPASIGSGMAVALLTTLYGLVLANVIYAPFGEKIAIEGDKIYELDLLVLEGVLALKGKKSSVHLKDIMKTYSKGSAESDKQVKK